MKLKLLKKKRKFKVGYNKNITLSHVADVYLKPDECVTFISGKTKDQYDVVKKDWGYYATPSVNGRLKFFNFKTAIFKNENKQIYVMLVKLDKMKTFKSYLKKERSIVMMWLDVK